MDPSRVEYTRRLLAGAPFEDAVNALSVAELREERKGWSHAVKAWQYNPKAPDWLRSMAEQNLQTCEASFRQRRTPA